MIEECTKAIGEEVKTRSYQYNGNVENVGFGCGTQAHSRARKPLQKIVVPGHISNLGAPNINIDDDDNYGPWGDNFIDGTVQLVWNKRTRQYDGYDIHSNYQLTDLEMETRLEMDYNRTFPNTTID